MFWLTMLAIAGGTTLGGTQIVVERYRVMVAPLLIGSAWFGMELPRRWLARSYAVWTILLIAGALFYVAYKALLPEVPAG